MQARSLRRELSSEKIRKTGFTHCANRLGHCFFGSYLNRLSAPGTDHLPNRAAIATPMLIDTMAKIVLTMVVAAAFCA